MLTVYIFQLQGLTLLNLPVRNKFDYYICTQVMDEEQFLTEWLDYNMNLLGFKNICIVNVGKPISVNITLKYDLAYKNHLNHDNSTKQNFNLCKKCFTSIQSQDLLLVQDIDQFLNIRNSKYLEENYDRYDSFYFADVRFGYVKDKTNEIFNKESKERFPMLATNTYRGLTKNLDNYNSDELRQLFNCSPRGGWNPCDTGNGKTMIKYGLISRLEPHFHETTKKNSKILDVDMQQMRLNHYYVRSREDGIFKGKKWEKLESMLGIIENNDFFKMVYDDSIRTSKQLR
ncbi:unnamed protein product [Didymodactylos carnosus]|uniref:Uncharacterized protein n=1 Tax=Didymodactylos carnosus TaxID=1234261 RepID=A0A815WCY9_9BILA|nr:unnamed protein product [Didymodactylos carnosus]CAF1547074.1 unnamed protein product [Didymodactylos carnosus]CAF4212310.1 unnamed protein product [Didymodactylos carnosus]CAF4407846.1 unnamed protein product [Didymodactylos carnosus]